MLKRVYPLAVAILLGLCPATFAQVRNLTPGPTNTKAITPVDRPEIKIQRVEILPNATRGMHAHDDVIYHVFLTMDAPLILSIEGEGDIRLEPWQSHFFKGGTVHAITNPGSEVVRFLEVFVNKTDKTATLDPSQALALAFSAAGESARRTTAGQ